MKWDDSACYIRRYVAADLTLAGKPARESLGAAGFEPTNLDIKNRSLATWLCPNRVCLSTVSLMNGVAYQAVGASDRHFKLACLS
jgi:hypothetical protein